MPRYIKLYLDDKRRNKYREINSRYIRLTKYLDNTNGEAQIRRFKSYCQSTTASRSVYSQFALSRNSLRHYASFGMVSGVTPSSW